MHSKALRACLLQPVCHADVARLDQFGLERLISPLSPFGIFLTANILVRTTRIAPMKKTESEATDAGDFHLGTLLGRRQAFGLIAARCSAADAACLREIRNQKSYKSVANNWAQFCSHHLGMSPTHANRMISYLDEFGPEYFELAQLTGIPVDAYRAIAPAVKDQALHYDGQVIALMPENAERLAAAVEKLRHAIAPEPVAPPEGERVSRIERRFAQLVAEISGLARTEPSGSTTRLRLGSALIAARERNWRPTQQEDQ